MKNKYYPPGAGLGPAGDLGDVTIVKGSRSRLGSCNFCSDPGHRVVWEMSGKRQVVRFCRTCLIKIKETPMRG